MSRKKNSYSDFRDYLSGFRFPNASAQTAPPKREASNRIGIGFQLSGFRIYFSFGLWALSYEPSPSTAQSFNRAAFNGKAIQREAFNGTAIQPHSYSTAQLFNGKAIQREAFNGAAIQREAFNGAAIQRAAFNIPNL